MYKLKKMKTKILFTAMLLILTMPGMSNNDAVNAATSDETIRICTTPDTRSLVESWTTDFRKNNPEFDFEIKSTGYSDFNDELANDNSLGFLLKRPGISIAGESLWQMVVGRDVIVPVISSENPFAETLKAEGISQKNLSGIVKSETSPDWN